MRNVRRRKQLSTSLYHVGKARVRESAMGNRYSRVMLKNIVTYGNSDQGRRYVFNFLRRTGMTNLINVIKIASQSETADGSNTTLWMPTAVKLQRRRTRLSQTKTQQKQTSVTLLL